MMLRGAPISVIDFETTGVDAWSCEPVEVAIVQTRLGLDEPKLVYRMLIRTQAPVPAEATKVHGITDEQLAANGRDASAVARDIHSWTRDRVICAYNLAYDWPILNRMVSGVGWKPVAFTHGLDPMIWYRQLRGKFSGKLVDACSEHGVPFDGEAHSAAADAMATAKLIPVLLGELARSGLIEKGMTVEGMWALTDKWALEQEVNLCAWLRKKGWTENHGWSRCIEAAGEK